MNGGRYLAIGMLFALLLAVAFAYGRAGYAMGEGAAGSMMMGGGGTRGSSTKEKPFDLRFIDEMPAHHLGAIASSEHMISDSDRPELDRLAEDIEKSQSEQIDRMRAWRERWYPDAEQEASGIRAGTMGDGGMMGGSMRGKMGGDATDEIFLRMMIPHHQTAVDMSERALSEAEHPELEELAREIIEEQSAEIEQMQRHLEKITAS